MATPIALYPFNDNLIDVVGGNTLTMNGSINYVPGYYGSAMDFGVHSGTKAKNLTINNSTIITGLSELTITAWVRISGGSNRQVLFSNVDTPTPEGMILRYNNAGSYWEAYFYLIGSSGFAGGPFSSSSISENTWTHIALVWDGAEFRLYINSTLASSVAAAATLGGSTPMIGASAYHSIHKDWSGMIDDFRIYSKALSPTEVADSSLEWIATTSRHYVAYCPSNGLIFTCFEEKLFITKSNGNKVETMSLPISPTNIFYDSSVDRIYMSNETTLVIVLNPHNFSTEVISLQGVVTEALFTPSVQGSIFKTDSNMAVIR